MDFRDELYRASKSIDEIVELEKQEEIKRAIEDAEEDYLLIKAELLEQAKQGKYSISNGNQKIKLYFNKTKINMDFKLRRSSTAINKTLFNPKGSYATMMTYSLINSNHYNCYMKRMDDLCEKDGISVKAFGMYNYHGENIELFDIPGSIVKLIMLESELSVCLECAIEYGRSMFNKKEKQTQTSRISSLKSEGIILLKNMGYSMGDFAVQKNQCDITVYKNDIEYGIICKTSNYDMELEKEGIKQVVLDCIKGIEHVEDDYSVFFLKSYYNGLGFSNVRFNFDSDTTIVGRVSYKSIQYNIKYYCEEGFGLRNNVQCECYDVKKDIKETEKNNYLEKAEDNFDKMEGHEFETFCAKLLEKNGYKKVEVTRGSGDQGIDIIAYRDDIKYGIQCKCYSSDIGNKAVQEVYAGKAFYHCHVGVVLTNRYFTKSAIELAERNGIILWDRDRLLELIKK